MQLKLFSLDLKNVFWLKKRSFSLFFDHNELLLRKSKMMLFFLKDGLAFIYANLMLIVKFG